MYQESHIIMLVVEVIAGPFFKNNLFAFIEADIVITKIMSDN